MVKVCLDSMVREITGAIILKLLVTNLLLCYDYILGFMMRVGLLVTKNDITSTTLKCLIQNITTAPFHVTTATFMVSTARLFVSTAS